MERNPHSGDTKDVALVMMLFEAARLAAEIDGDPVVARRRRHRRPGRAHARRLSAIAIPVIG